MSKKKKGLALHWKILIGMAVGVIFSLVLLSTSWGASMTSITVKGEEVDITRAGLFVRNWIKPFGNMFINALKLIAVPLILASLIKGVSDLKDISKLSKMGLRTILTYLGTTIVAVTIGLLIVNAVEPGKSITEET
ncbi:MAG: cation:dicarboxylate symporter family transporter, partial [Psychroflexus sp.]